MKKKARSRSRIEIGLNVTLWAPTSSGSSIMDLRIIYSPKTSFSAIQYTDGIQKVKIELK